MEVAGKSGRSLVGCGATINCACVVLCQISGMNELEVEESWGRDWCEYS